ncbi:MAG: lysophospholipid acyltransferase family protein [Pseudomonadota bacterium]
MRVLRSLVFWAAVFGWTLVVLGLACVVSGLTLGLLRHRLINVFAPLYGRPLLWLAGIRMEVRGWEHLSTPSGRIIAFNHNSFLEVLLLSALNVPRYSWLGKRSFLYIPVMGVGMWLLGGHFIDRGHKKKAHASIQKLGEDLELHRLSAYVAPEGTRSRTGALQPFKMGLFHLALDTGAPIVPMVIYGVHDLLAPDDWKVSPGTVHIEIHPPIDTSGWTRESLREQADALHADYARWLAEGPGAP